ncbi:hypothetical protein DPMN_081373 [Dreissena polymorpha]|uniref:Uncharacterized protein n=1 Tax=Dreissena polymorpha TaxID=45954 RepID=A0A9D3Y8W6_DREPO|nr:hypothetical protein DPMN_081373 [Dreissena polymorpha]
MTSSSGSWDRFEPFSLHPSPGLVRRTSASPTKVSCLALGDLPHHGVLSWPSLCSSLVELAVTHPDRLSATFCIKYRL